MHMIGGIHFMAVCPKCGKKAIGGKKTCKRCGYTVNPDVSPVNYYMYDTKSPNVVYPMTVSKNHAKENPFGANKTVKKNRCPKCARRLSQHKRYCKCGYERPGFVNQKGARWFGFIFCILAVVATLFMPFVAVVGSEASVVTLKNGSLLSLFQFMNDSGNKMFNVMPSFGFTGEAGYVYTICVYAFILCFVLAVVHGLFAIFTRTKAAKRVRRALALVGFGALIYTVAFALAAPHFGSMPAEISGIVVNVKSFTVDVMSAALGVVGVFTSFILKMVAKRKAKKMA